MRLCGNEADNGNQRGITTMVLWMVAGYLVTAVAFYSYIVATAQEEPKECSATVIDMVEWQRSRDEEVRKAA